MMRIDDEILFPGSDDRGDGENRGSLLSYPQFTMSFRDIRTDRVPPSRRLRAIDHIVVELREDEHEIRRRERRVEVGEIFEDR